MVKIVPFACSLTNPREHGIASVAFCDVVNELHDDNCFPYSRTAERADLSALGKWANQIDDLDAGFQNAGTGVLFKKARGLAMNRISLLESDRSALVNRVPGHVENATKDSVAHWNRDRAAGICNGHSTLKTVGGRHRNRPHPPFPEMLLHLKRQFSGLSILFKINLQRIINAREVQESFRCTEISIYYRADDLDNGTFAHILGFIQPQAAPWLFRVAR